MTGLFQKKNSERRKCLSLRVLVNEWPGFTIEKPLDTRFTNFSRIAFT